MITSVSGTLSTFFTSTTCVINFMGMRFRAVILGKAPLMLPRGKKVFCCKAGNLQQYLDICSWTGCEEACPSDKQNVLTWDAGGPIGDNPRCDSYSSGDVFTNPTAVGDASDPKVGTLGKRKLCCPQEDSFKNCAWKGNKVCSELCNVSHALH